MEDGNMQTDQLKKHLQLFTEGTPVPDDDLPGAAPAADSKVDPVAGKKVVVVSPEVANRLREIFKRADEILKKYTDPKTKKPFESMDFESMTESEQQQYLMQNLHQLSEADQMVVLRAIATEGIGKDFAKAGVDAAKWGAEKIAIPLGKWALKTGEKAVGWTANKSANAVGKVWDSVLAPVVKYTAYGAVTIGMTGMVGIYVVNNYKDIFHLTPAVMKNLNMDDAREMASLQKELDSLLPKLPEDSTYGYPEDVAKQIETMSIRWDRFNEVLTDTVAAPSDTSDDPTIPDMIINKAKNTMKDWTK